MEKSKVKRAPKRGHYDESTIHGILDKEYVCSVGFVHKDYPVVIPTLYGRKNNKLYIHGATVSRMIVDLEKGIDVCLCVTIKNGLVLARSAFHHSMNYESVVVFGKAKLVSDQEKEAKLKIISDHILPLRWEEVRAPNQKELKATSVLEITIEEASAKIRTGPPLDEKEDYDLDIWAGVLPVNNKYNKAINDPELSQDIPLPPSVKAVV